MNVTALVAANCHSRKTPSGSIGQAAVWSRTKKAASPRAPATAIASTVSEDQPSVGAWMVGKAMLTTVASSAAIPEPSTVTASTQRPGAEEYDRAGASAVVTSGRSRLERLWACVSQ